MVMEINILATLLISILSAIYIYSSYVKNAKLAYTIKIANQEISNLHEQLNKKKEPRIQFWKIDKYTDDDLKNIEWNPDVLDSVIKILTYFAVKKTDMYRYEESRELMERLIWEANACHELLFFF